MPSEAGFVNHGTASINTYNDVTGNQYNNKIIQSRDAKDSLRTVAAVGAAWDSTVRYPAGTCCEGTRTTIMGDILQWIADSGNRGKVYWLTGAAGLGKSAIAQSLAARCKDRDVLGASFFFSEDDEHRNDARKLISTIAYQLCLTSKHQEKRALKALKTDPGALDRTPPEQVETLLIKTIPHEFGRNVVIVDAIDQGGSEAIIEQILPAVLQAARSTPLRFVIASQMTLTIQKFIQNNTTDISTTDLHDHDADDNIRHFYTTRFAQLSVTHGVNGWYSDLEIEQLVATTGGLFMYAAAVVKYVGSGRHFSPRRRLEDVLSIDIKEFPEMRDRMDALYRRILLQIPQRDYDELVRQVIGTICLVSYPLTLPDLDLLLGLEAGDSWGSLQDLHAFFQVPNQNDKDSCVRLAHRFFRAFIFDPQRSKQHAIDSKGHQTHLGARCLDTLSSNLRRNICKLSPSGTLTDPQTDAQVHSRCGVAINRTAEYASRFWCHHLRSGIITQDSLVGLRSFLQRSLLHWIEAMGLLGRLNEAVYIMHEVHPFVQRLQDPLAIERLEDVQRTMGESLAKITDWPILIYDLDLSESVTIECVAPEPVPKEDQPPAPAPPKLPIHSLNDNVRTIIPAPVMRRAGAPHVPPHRQHVSQSPSPEREQPAPPEVTQTDDASQESLDSTPLSLREKMSSPSLTRVSLPATEPHHSPPRIPPRPTVPRLIEPSHPSVWCIDHSPSLSYKFSYLWSKAGSATPHPRFNVHVPELAGTSYEEEFPKDRWSHGWTCSNCGRLAGDLVIYSVSGQSQAILCEECLFKDHTLRSQTFVVFSWMNRDQVGQHEHVPKLDRIRPSCDVCQAPVADGTDWLHCIGCRHMKSRDICTACHHKQLKTAASPCVFIRCVAAFVLPDLPARPPGTVKMAWTHCSNSRAASLEREWSTSSFGSLSPPTTSSSLLTPPDIPWRPAGSWDSSAFPPFSPPIARRSNLGLPDGENQNITIYTGGRQESLNGDYFPRTKDVSVPPKSNIFHTPLPPPLHPSIAKRSALPRLTTSR